MNDLEDILKEFVVEATEGLDQLDKDLIELEQDPHCSEVLDQVFRTIHTIKGSSGFLSLAKLEAIAHVGENLLSLLRAGKKRLDAEGTSALLAMADAIREILGHLEREQNEGEADYGRLVARLDALSSENDGSPTAVGEASPGDVPSSPAETDVAPAGDASGGGAPAHEAVRHSAAETSIRVDVALLDKLMNLVGELVLTRNQILQFSANQEEPSFIGTSQRLNLVTTELQEGVMKTRMQPIGNVWTKFPRVVRDLALTCGKEVRIEMQGRATELDKTILESIKDPLTHAIRNAVDHGIEPPEVRRELGKSAEGRILLRAFHEGGQVNIEVSDDGRGIDPARIRDKAIALGLASAERVARMGERELINLVTLPGFSTAEKVTNVSGRGVGMDVVRANIEKIGGTIDIHSVLGTGTTLKIKIPLTLAIIPALIVTSGGQRFAIPQVNLLELVRLEGAQARERIERVHGAPVYRLRGNLLPLAYLDSELGEPAGRRSASGEGAFEEATNIVVLQADDRQFGIVVESILDTEEIVVKPLGKPLKSLPAFAGATIMGDGKVALILDVIGLAQKAGIICGEREQATPDPRAEQEDSKDRKSMLLLSAGGTSLAAIELSMVDRLEEFDVSSVERTADLDVVQYRGEIMPLVHLARVLRLAVDESDPGERLQVVVLRTRTGRKIGLVVARILDTVDTELNLVRHSSRPGIIGAATLQRRVTDVLDVNAILDAALPNFGAQSPIATGTGSSQ
ncbi:MAG: chemotaxis protein CheW [Planctomycetes bacterium]|nr:chemotaxis protein CheW [Planctomycetota bacterium]